MADQRSPDHEQSCTIIIPARFQSSRFPGKPLVRLKGSRGVERSLIEWTWRAARQVVGVGGVLVATDDRRIADEVERFGGTVAITPSECANGTERCAAALKTLADVPGIVVNFQGDAPLTPPGIVAAVIDRMRGDPELPVATPAIPCGADTYRHLIEDRAAGRVGGTTVVFDSCHRALYFSKNVIPYTASADPAVAHPVHLHIGLYAYRSEALAAYIAAPPSALEISEGLEQLRFLDMGFRVGTVVCDAPEGSMIELNNPADAALIEHELRRRSV